MSDFCMTQSNCAFQFVPSLSKNERLSPFDKLRANELFSSSGAQ